MGWPVDERITLKGIGTMHLDQLRADVFEINASQEINDSDSCTSIKFPTPMNRGFVSTTYEGYNDIERQLNSDCSCIYHRRRPECDRGVLPILFVGFTYSLMEGDGEAVLSFEGYKSATYDFVDKKRQMMKICRGYGCTSVEYSKSDEYCGETIVANCDDVVFDHGCVHNGDEEVLKSSWKAAGGVAGMEVFGGF